MRLSKNLGFDPELAEAIKQEICRQRNVPAITAKGIARPVEERLRHQGYPTSLGAVEAAAAQILARRWGGISKTWAGFKQERVF